jgi:hypothetical protein
MDNVQNHDNCNIKLLILICMHHFQRIERGPNLSRCITQAENIDTVFGLFYSFTLFTESQRTVTYTSNYRQGFDW